MEEEWISAAEAFRRVEEATDKKRAAGLICSRVHDELIATRARRLVVDHLVRDNVAIPSAFWWRRDDVWMKQEWTTGDFESTSPQRERCRAYGVEFLKADVEAMFPPPRLLQSPAADSTGTFQPASVCFNELMGSLRLDAAQVSELILRNCRAGLVPSRCKSLWWRETDRYGPKENELRNVAVPDWVWEDCLSDPDKILNFAGNRLAGEGLVNGEQLKVRVTGLEFEVGAILDVERLVKASAGVAQPLSPIEQIAPPAVQRGRKLSEMWPDWVAELVTVVHKRAPYLSADMNLAGPKATSGSERAGAMDRRDPVKPV